MATWPSDLAGLSVLNAVAMAGGYTYRANESTFYIRREGGQEEGKFSAGGSTKLGHGDNLNVVERWI